jgi:hypothetical protein
MRDLDDFLWFFPRNGYFGRLIIDVFSPPDRLYPGLMEVLAIGL